MVALVTATYKQMLFGQWLQQGSSLILHDCFLTITSRAFECSVCLTILELRSLQTRIGCHCWADVADWHPAFAAPTKLEGDLCTRRLQLAKSILVRLNLRRPAPCVITPVKYARRSHPCQRLRNRQNLGGSPVQSCIVTHAIQTESGY